jgi:hypothetical protein
MNIWTKAFWKSVVERILATAAFALVGFLSVDGFDLRTAHWGDIAQAVGVAGALSLLKGLIANQLTGNGPSVVTSEQVVPEMPRHARDDDADGVPDIAD